MTNIPKINTLKFLGVISKNKYVSLLCSSNGKFCGLALNNKYICLKKSERPMVTTSTAMFPTSAFLRGLKRKNSKIPPNNPQRMTETNTDI